MSQTLEIVEKERHTSRIGAELLGNTNMGLSFSSGLEPAKNVPRCYQN